MPSSHLILCRPLLLLPQSLPASESFPMSWLFTSGSQSLLYLLPFCLPANTTWLLGYHSLAFLCHFPTHSHLFKYYIVGFHVLELCKTRITLCVFLGFPGGASGKELTCQCRRHKRYRFSSWVGKIPWRRAWQPTPVFLPGESHEQRSLLGYTLWGRKRVGHNWAHTHTRCRRIKTEA